MTDIVERLRRAAPSPLAHGNREAFHRNADDRREAADEIERLRTITRLQENEIKMLRGRLCADAPFNAVEDYKQFRRDNPDTVTVDE